MNKLSCPECQSEIGFITFAKAPTPWHLKCYSCSTQVKLEKNNYFILFIAILCGVGIGLLLTAKTFGTFAFLISIVCAILAFEYLIYNYVKIMKIRIIKK